MGIGITPLRRRKTEIDEAAKSDEEEKERQRRRFEFRNMTRKRRRKYLQRKLAKRAKR